MTTPLILLPGMMCDARLFGPQVAALEADILTPVPAKQSMGSMAEEVLAKAPDRFALAGLSMGGILAMEILRLVPERVMGLALLDTSHLAEADEMKARREVHLDRVSRGFLAEVMRDDLKPNYLAPGPNQAAILTLCMDMAMSLGPAAFYAHSKALQSRRDQTETLSSWRGPTLVLCGANDQLCPVERHEQMHALMPQSELVIVEGAAHLPTLERPDETTAALAKWLSEI